MQSKLINVYFTEADATLARELLREDPSGGWVIANAVFHKKELGELHAAIDAALHPPSKSAPAVSPQETPPVTRLAPHASLSSPPTAALIPARDHGAHPQAPNPLALPLDWDLIDLGRKRHALTRSFLPGSIVIPMTHFDTSHLILLAELIPVLTATLSLLSQVEKEAA